MKFITAIINHIRDWAEAYIWAPCALLFIPFTEELYSVATGRPTVDDPWLWIVGYAPKFFVSIMAIVMVSAFQQQNGIWLTKAEQIQNQGLAIHQGYQKCAMLFIFAYIWLH